MGKFFSGFLLAVLAIQVPTLSLYAAQGKGSFAVSGKSASSEGPGNTPAPPVRDGSEKSVQKADTLKINPSTKPNGDPKQSSK